MIVQVIRFISQTVRTSIQTESSLLNRLSIGSVVSSPRSATSQYMAGMSSLPAERAVPPNAKVSHIACKCRISQLVYLQRAPISAFQFCL